MTVVVGYIPDQYGEAALTAGIEEAERRGTGIVVVNATKGDALVDRRYVGEAGLAGLEERLAGLDMTHEVRQAIGADVADEILPQPLPHSVRYRGPGQPEHLPLRLPREPADRSPFTPFLPAGSTHQGTAKPLSPLVGRFLGHPSVEPMPTVMTPPAELVHSG